MRLVGLAAHHLFKRRRFGEAQHGNLLRPAAPAWMPRGKLDDQERLLASLFDVWMTAEVIEPMLDSIICDGQ